VRDGGGLGRGVGLEPQVREEFGGGSVDEEAATASGARFCGWEAAAARVR